ncbi:helix-turn-helix transcriptional regulator [Tritonibacter mobilis]|uniref:helix-turn-helix transcriptional regulator n=1 Tax=Tritonibacter mobilis TaxID=379347 RepID=UPI0039A65439
MTLSNQISHSYELLLAQSFAEAAQALGKATANSQKPTLPRRGLSRVEAAQYIGVGTSTFDTMVKAGDMPKPVRIGARTIWDIHALDAAFDLLATAEIDNPWAA